MYSVTYGDTGQPYLHTTEGSFCAGGSTFPKQERHNEVASDPWRSWSLTLRIDRALLAAIDAAREQIDAALDVTEPRKAE